MSSRRHGQFVIKSSFIKETNSVYSLKIPSVTEIAISAILTPERKCFRTKRQTVELKLSLKFCVRLLKHLFRR